MAPSEQRRVRLQDRRQACGGRPCRLHALRHLPQRPQGYAGGVLPPCRAHGRESDWSKAAGGPDGRDGGQLRRGDGPRRGAPQSCRVAGQALPPGRGCGLLGPALRGFRVGHRLRHRRGALRLELPPHLLRGVPGAGKPARMDAGEPRDPQCPGHRARRQTLHPLRDQPDAARPGAGRPQVETPVSGRGRRRG